jgi:hypothetical protein
MKATEFDEKFDNDEDVIPFLNMSTAHRSALITKRVNVDFPEWMVSDLDKEARRLGVTRQSLIKLWVAQHLDSPPTDRGRNSPFGIG